MLTEAEAMKILQEIWPAAPESSPRDLRIARQGEYWTGSDSAAVSSVYALIGPDGGHLFVHVRDRTCSEAIASYEAGERAATGDDEKDRTRENALGLNEQTEAEQDGSASRAMLERLSTLRKGSD